MPPVNFRFAATGLKSLLFSWGPVPTDFQHGIILGYQLRYKTLKGQKFVVNRTNRQMKLDVAALDIYSPYPASLAAFTRIGLGPWDVVPAVTGTSGTLHGISRLWYSMWTICISLLRDGFWEERCSVWLHKRSSVWLRSFSPSTSISCNENGWL